MAEQSGCYRWGYCFNGPGRGTARQGTARRGGAWPGPAGRGKARQGTEIPAPAVEVDQAPALFLSALPVMALFSNGPGAPLPINGLGLFGLFLIALAIMLAMRQMIRALRRE